MTLDDLLEALHKIRAVCHGGVTLEVYSDTTQDFVPLDDVEFTPAEEYGAFPARVRLT